VHDLAGARAAEAAGADFVLLGPVFPTPGKARVLGPEGAAAVRRALAVPIVPIGGIDAARIRALRGAGFGSVAVIRAIAAAPDPETAARRIRALLEADDA
jgi:thiamine-phosphate pyrophosphorylase